VDTSSNPTTTKYQQVTVDVPEDRIAEFHAFFGRFLAGRPGRGRRGRPGRHHRPHGRDCGRRREATEQPQEQEQATGATEL
jgi:hypothetical protein